MNLRAISITLSVGVLLGIMGFGLHTASLRSIVDVLVISLFILSFSGFPPIVSIMLAGCAKNAISQTVSAMASLLYGLWFAYAVYDCFYVNLDAQSGLIFIFVGFWALPVLLLLWLAALVIEIRHRKKQAEP